MLSNLHSIYTAWAGKPAGNQNASHLIRFILYFLRKFFSLFLIVYYSKEFFTGSRPDFDILKNICFIFWMNRQKISLRNKITVVFVYKWTFSICQNKPPIREKQFLKIHSSLTEQKVWVRTHSTLQSIVQLWTTIRNPWAVVKSGPIGPGFDILIFDPATIWDATLSASSNYTISWSLRFKKFCSGKFWSRSVRHGPCRFFGYQFLSLEPSLQDRPVSFHESLTKNLWQNLCFFAEFFFRAFKINKKG